MERKFKVADFAALLGIVPKTVYKMIERNEIVTVNERVNNRNTTLIVASDEQIQELKKNFGKEQSNTGKYYENVTENEQLITDVEYEVVKNDKNQAFTSEFFDRLMTLNERYNEQLNTYLDRIREVSDELITAQKNAALLEDKSLREGLYLNEINELKQKNEELRTVNEQSKVEMMKIKNRYLIIIGCLLLLLTGYFTYNLAANKGTKITAPSELETVINEVVMK